MLSRFGLARPTAGDLVADDGTVAADDGTDDIGVSVADQSIAPEDVTAAVASPLKTAALWAGGAWLLSKFLLRMFVAAVFAAALFAPTAARADEVYIGSLISAGATINNSTTATPFTSIPAGTDIAIQCSAAVYYVVGTSTSLAATSTGVEVPVSVLYDIQLNQGMRYIAILPVAGGATTCKVYQVFRRPLKVQVVSQ